jgi:hypothetical protein
MYIKVTSYLLKKENFIKLYKSINEAGTVGEKQVR